ncbi:hypothetical protein [Mangrovibrevibacter kandeliae]|nr:hypothetical protein [Aurantimonas sp. CSK15Z-1]
MTNRAERVSAFHETAFAISGVIGTPFTSVPVASIESLRAV